MLSAKAVSSEAETKPIDYTPAAQKRKQATGQQIYENVLKGEAYLRDTSIANNGQAENLVKGLANRLRSAGGVTGENLAYVINDNVSPDSYFGKTSQKVLDNNYAGQISDIANQQLMAAKENTGDFGDFLIDTADAGANMASQALLSAMVLPVPVSSKFAITQGISSGAQKYKDTRESGGNKAEAWQRGISSGAVAYATEAIAGIGKTGLSKLPGVNKVVTHLDEYGTKNWLTHVLAVGAEEGGEEGLEYAFEYASDIIADLIYKGEVETDFNVAELFQNVASGFLMGAGFASVTPNVNVETDTVAEQTAEPPVNPNTPKAKTDTLKIANEQEGAFANAGENKKADVEQPNISEINLEQEVNKFGVKSVNDYVGTQKAVLKELNNKNFFNENGSKRNDANKESGIVVKTDIKSINEMFSNGKRFQTLPRELKNRKLAVVNQIPYIIQNGTIVNKDVISYHDNQKKHNNVKFTYFEAPIKINGETYYAVVGAKHTPNGYHAWTLETRPNSQKNSSMATASAVTQTEEGLNEVAIRTGTTLAQNNNIVNTGDGGFGKNTVGAAESNPNTYAHLQNEYDVMDLGENPRARDAGVPKKDAQGNRVSQSVRTIMEASVTPDELIPAFEKEVAEGTFENKGTSNKKAVEDAAVRIANKPFKDAVNEFRRVYSDDKILSKDDLVFGEMLFSMAAQNGEVDVAMELASMLSSNNSRTGDSMQAQRILKRLSPEGRLYHAQRITDKFNKDKHQKNEIKLSEETVKKVLNAKTDKEIEAANDAVAEDIAKQLVSTKMDKWNAWRYLSMLGNPKTHIRNVMGNAMFVPVRALKNGIKATLEKSYAARHKNYERTTTTAKATDAQKNFAKESFEKNKNAIVSGGNYRFENDIEKKKKVFDNAALEWARNKNSELLEKEDMKFLEHAYVNSLAKYLRANNIDPQKASTKQITRAENYAAEEAKKATYRDESKVAQAIERLSRTNGITRVLSDALLPFRKTPINILARGVEYSPVELAKALTYDLGKVRKGEMEPQKMLDHVASGLTGTGVVALGALLAHLNLISGGDDEDDKAQNFGELQGEQNYAIKIGDYSYTLDWATPISMPLFVGVEAYNALKGEGFDSGDVFNATLDAISKTADPMIGLSMLQNVEKLISGNYGGEGSGLGNLIKEAVISYALQAFPTLGTQIAQTIDPKQRNAYYTDKTNDIPDVLEIPLNRILAKIPGATMLLPEKVDAWGKTKMQEENLALRIFENFVSPGYVSKKNTTKVDEMLEQLYAKTGDHNVFPSSLQKSVTIDGKNVPLSANDYVEAQKKAGQTKYSMLNQLIADKNFNKLPADQKAEIVSDIYGYGNAKGKQAVSDYIPTITWYKKMEEAQKEGVSVPDYLIARNKYTELESKNDRTVNLQMYDYLIADKSTSAKQDVVILEKVANVDMTKYKNATSKDEEILDLYSVVADDNKKEADIKTLVGKGYSNAEALAKYNVADGNKKYEDGEFKFGNAKNQVKKANKLADKGYDPETIVKAANAVTSFGEYGTNKNFKTYKKMLNAVGIFDEKFINAFWNIYVNG